MKRWLLLAIILLAAAGAIMYGLSRKGGEMQKEGNGQFKLTSLAFENDSAIPEKYSCKGDNISPPLRIEGAPEDTKSFALIMHDPDAPAGDWVHWTLWNIPANTTDIAEASVPAGAVEGMTSFDKPGYGGPCPPSGTHHYIFELYALNESLDFPNSTSRNDLEAAAEKHSLAKTSLIGLFSH